jgi:hypothetical protein
MTELPETQRPDVCLYWSEMVKNILACQWELFDGQYQVGLRIMERALSLPSVPTAESDRPGEPGVKAAPTLTEKLQRFERLAVERVKQGLAPPREIYEVPYRDLIDWGAFPEWARPTDPELFESCSHEG